MRIVFMGTPDFAVPTLEALVHAAHEVVCVYTQPPRRSGRGKKLQPTPVHQAAERLGIEVRHPSSLKSRQEKGAFAALDADVGVVAAYGLILPQAVLDAPTHGCLNVHASILPRWRGAAPIQRAILAGETGTGVTIMQMEAGLDTGPMLATVRTPIDHKTAGDLTDELADKGAQLMVGTLRELSKHIPVAQDDTEATHAPKIDKAEARLDWSQDAVQVERQVRAFAPWPGAFFEYEGAEGMERVKVLAAEVAEGSGAPGTVLDEALTVACGKGALRLTRVQRAGKPAMDTADFQRGRAIGKGARLVRDNVR